MIHRNTVVSKVPGRQKIVTFNFRK